MNSDKTNQLFEESGGKILCFLLGEQEYGIQILEAREVVPLMQIEEAPNTPGFMRGIMNLRGSIIPVVDLRMKFGLPDFKPTKESCILKVDISGHTTGVMVDSLIGVRSMKLNEFEENPDMGSHINTKFIHGMFKKDTEVIFILNMEEVLSNEELLQVHEHS